MSAARHQARLATTGLLTPSRAAFGGIFVVTGLGLLSVGATLPVLPRYVEGPLGRGDLEVGIVTGAFALTGIACRPLAGHLADRRGRRIVVIAGAIVMAVAGTLYFVPAGVGGLVVARLLLGAGEGMVYTAGSAWIVDIAPPERRWADHRALRTGDLGRALARAADRRADPARRELRRGLGVRDLRPDPRSADRPTDPGDVPPPSRRHVRTAVLRP